MTPTDEETMLVRAMASHAAESAVDGRRRLLEEHAAAFRWLMASFLAINGGGLLFLKDFQPSEGYIRLVAAVAFYVGIVSALAIAWFGQKSSNAAIQPMSKLSVFWTMAAQSGEIDEGQLESLNKEIAGVTSKARLAPIAGWLSLLAFTIGLGAIIVGNLAK